MNVNREPEYSLTQRVIANSLFIVAITALAVSTAESLSSPPAPSEVTPTPTIASYSPSIDMALGRARIAEVTPTPSPDLWPTRIPTRRYQEYVPGVRFVATPSEDPYRNTIMHFTPEPSSTPDN